MSLDKDQSRQQYAAFYNRKNVFWTIVHSHSVCYGYNTFVYFIIFRTILDSFCEKPGGQTSSRTAKNDIDILVFSQRPNLSYFWPLYLFTKDLQLDYVLANKFELTFSQTWFFLFHFEIKTGLQSLLLWVAAEILEKKFPTWQGFFNPWKDGLLSFCVLEKILFLLSTHS